MSPPSFGACYVLLCVAVLSEVRGDDISAITNDPCSESSNTILMPRQAVCLVPFSSSYTWVQAQAACERWNGRLYMPPALMLRPNSSLVQCLSANPNRKHDDVWLNAVGFWYQHFVWSDGTMVNKVTYCTTEKPPSEFSPVSSRTLSVDYCVSMCHRHSMRYVVLHSTIESPSCYCASELEARYKVDCGTTRFSFNDLTKFYIVHTDENSLIKVDNSEAFPRTEILCATVDSETISSREMKSDTCFTPYNFICQLDDAEVCSNKDSYRHGTEAYFFLNSNPRMCLLRVRLSYSWYTADSFCKEKGGTLWIMTDLNHMNQVSFYLDSSTRYRRT